MPNKILNTRKNNIMSKTKKKKKINKKEKLKKTRNSQRYKKKGGSNSRIGRAAVALGASAAAAFAAYSIYNNSKESLTYKDLELSEIPKEDFTRYKNLKELNLINLPNLVKLPESIGQLKNLKTLKLSNNPKLTSLPSSIIHLRSLETLDIEDCNSIDENSLYRKDFLLNHNKSISSSKYRHDCLAHSQIEGKQSVETEVKDSDDTDSIVSGDSENYKIFGPHYLGYIEGVSLEGVEGLSEEDKKKVLPKDFLLFGESHNVIQECTTNYIRREGDVCFKDWIYNFVDLNRSSCIDFFIEEKLDKFIDFEINSRPILSSQLTDLIEMKKTKKFPQNVRVHKVDLRQIFDVNPFDKFLSLDLNIGHIINSACVFLDEYNIGDRFTFPEYLSVEGKLAKSGEIISKDYKQNFHMKLSCEDGTPFDKPIGLIDSKFLEGPHISFVTDSPLRVKVKEFIEYITNPIEPFDVVEYLLDYTDEEVGIVMKKDFLKIDLNTLSSQSQVRKPNIKIRELGDDFWDTEEGRLLEIIEIDCKPSWSKLRNDTTFTLTSRVEILRAPTLVEAGAAINNRTLDMSNYKGTGNVYKITMRDVSKSIKELFEQVSLFLYFLKCVLIKQFEKSYLPVQYIRRKLSIFDYTTRYNTQSIKIKGVPDNIILRGFIFADTFKAGTNPKIMITAFVMDIYTLCRMFAKFDSKKENLTPEMCKGDFYSPTHNIFFGGSLHSKNYFDFLKTLSFKRVIEYGRRTDSDSDVLNKSTKNYVELKKDFFFFSGPQP